MCILHIALRHTDGAKRMCERKARAFAQFDKSLCCSHAPCMYPRKLQAQNEGSSYCAWSHRLVWVFIVRRYVKSRLWPKQSLFQNILLTVIYCPIYHWLDVYIRSLKRSGHIHCRPTSNDNLCKKSHVTQDTAKKQVVSSDCSSFSLFHEEIPKTLTVKEA